MEKRIKEIISNYTEVTIDEIKNESSLLEDLDIDSLDLMRMIIDFEKEFNVEIDEEKISEVITVQDIYKLCGQP